MGNKLIPTINSLLANFLEIINDFIKTTDHINFDSLTDIVGSLRKNLNRFDRYINVKINIFLQTQVLYKEPLQLDQTLLQDDFLQIKKNQCHHNLFLLPELLKRNTDPKFSLLIKLNMDLIKHLIKLNEKINKQFKQGSILSPQLTNSYDVSKEHQGNSQLLSNKIPKGACVELEKLLKTLQNVHAVLVFSQNKKISPKF